MATITATEKYLDFASITTYEELSIAIARKILDFQQDSTLNPNALEVITINTNENTDTITISMTARAKLKTDGSLQIENRFPSATFTSGAGSYPFDGENILEAYCYIIMYQHSLEISSVTNGNAENQFCSFSIESVDTVGETWPLNITIEQNEAPLVIIQNAENSTSKGKVYLL
jgi:hypothetical protein